MLRRIILPQAFVAMIPPWGNLFIELLKSTSLVSLITLTDLTFKAQQLNQTTLKTVPIFTLVLLIYLAHVARLTIGMRLLETPRRTRASRGRSGMIWDWAFAFEILPILALGRDRHHRGDAPRLRDRRDPRPRHSPSLRIAVPGHGLADLGRSSSSSARRRC